MTIKGSRKRIMHTSAVKRVTQLPDGATLMYHFPTEKRMNVFRVRMYQIAKKWGVKIKISRKVSKHHWSVVLTKESDDE